MNPPVNFLFIITDQQRADHLGCYGSRVARTPAIEPDVFRAVDGISFSIGHGESLGLVGESGCGKSTTSMMVMRLLDQTSGRISFDGEEIGAILPPAFARLPQRKAIQMVFQDPTDSLNPRFTAARAIAVLACVASAPAADNFPKITPDPAQVALHVEAAKKLAGSDLAETARVYCLPITDIVTESVAYAKAGPPAAPRTGLRRRHRSAASWWRHSP